jgi:hypothetical protein
MFKSHGFSEMTIFKQAKVVIRLGLDTKVVILKEKAPAIAGAFLVSI